MLYLHYVSLICIFHVGMYNQLWYAYELFVKMPQWVYNSVVAKMGKGKSKDVGNEVRTGWKDPTELKVFCDICDAQALDDKRSWGYLRKEGVDVVIKQLGEMGKVVTHMQFKNKWDHLRKQWKT